MFIQYFFFDGARDKVNGQGSWWGSQADDRGIIVICAEAVQSGGAKWNY